MDHQKNIRSFLDEQKKCLSNILKDTSEIDQVVNHLIKIRNQKKTIFTMGNGGSASTASHFVSDILKTCITKNNNRFQATSLVDNIPVILAWSNDVSYESIFLEQLKNSLKKNDVVIGFSGSGNSTNILNALRYAKKNNAFCIGFTGESGGKMKNLCDICIRVPSNEMLSIESQHVILCHCIANCIRHSGIPLFKYD
jgi:D-sedoheptulose 7-phosphate isomerase